MKKIRLADVLKGHGLENAASDAPGYAGISSAKKGEAFRVDPPPLWPPITGNMKELTAAFSTQFQEASSFTPGQWEAMFRSFPKPLDEVKRWLRLAEAFSEITTHLGKWPSKGEQRDVLLIVWFASVTGVAPSLDCIELSTLSLEDAEFVREEYFAFVKNGEREVLA